MTWVCPSLTGWGPRSDTHWHGVDLGLTFTDGAGDLGLTLTDRAGNWVWHSLTGRGSWVLRSLTGRGPGSDIHWRGGGSWVLRSLTGRGPGSDIHWRGGGPGCDTHWQGGDLGLILTDRAWTWDWHSLTWRGPESDTHWLGGDLGLTLTDLGFVTWRYQARIPIEPDICHRGCAYTVLQTVQRHGVYSAAYSTVHYKEPLKSFEITVGHSPGFFTHSALLVSVRPRSTPCQDAGPLHVRLSPHPVSEWQAQVFSYKRNFIS